MPARDPTSSTSGAGFTSSNSAGLAAAQLAEEIFAAYNEQGPHPWKTFDGREVPRWAALNDQVRAKWAAAARRAITRLTGKREPVAEYSIGYGTACQLRQLAESEAEQAAIARLVEFRGDARDVRLAAAILDRAGEGANARELIRHLPSEPADSNGPDAPLHKLAATQKPELTQQAHAHARIAELEELTARLSTDAASRAELLRQRETELAHLEQRREVLHTALGELVGRAHTLELADEWPAHARPEGWTTELLGAFQSALRRAEEEVTRG